jgi:hypothetical protein
VGDDELCSPGSGLARTEQVNNQSCRRRFGMRGVTKDLEGKSSSVGNDLDRLLETFVSGLLDD